jgi:uncharacterized protein (TIGR02646 family)
MRKINKSAPPPKLTKYKKEIGASYDNMDSDVKDELKTFLLNEQGWVCGYCQQKITMRKMKIEHFCEQSICNGLKGTMDKRLDYTNLMAVCLGDAGSYGLHCDSSKATRTPDSGLPIEVSPWIKSHISRLKYKSSGILDSTDERHTGEINKILKLNNDYLKDLRRKKFLKIFQLSTGSNTAKNKAKMRRLLESDLDGGVKFNNSFPGLSEYMLNKFC